MCIYMYIFPPFSTMERCATKSANICPAQAFVAIFGGVSRSFVATFAEFCPGNGNIATTEL